MVSFKLTVALRGSSAAISGIDALRGSLSAISIVVMPHCQVYCRQTMSWHRCSQGELGCYIYCRDASLSGVLSAGYELEIAPRGASKEFLRCADAQKKNSVKNENLVMECTTRSLSKSHSC